MEFAIGLFGGEGSGRVGRPPFVLSLVASLFRPAQLSLSPSQAISPSPSKLLYDSSAQHTHSGVELRLKRKLCLQHFFFYLLHILQIFLNNIGNWLTTFEVWQTGLEFLKHRAQDSRDKKWNLIINKSKKLFSNFAARSELKQKHRKVREQTWMTSRNSDPKLWRQKLTLPPTMSR